MASDRDEENFFAPPRSAEPSALPGADVDPVDPGETHGVRYRLEPRDMESFLKGHQQAAKPTPASRPTGWVWPVLVVVFAVMSFVTSGRRLPGGRARESYGPMLTQVVVILAILGLAVLVIRGLAARARRKLGEQLKEFPNQEVRISIAGMEGRTEDGSITRRPWRSIRDVVVTETSILVYVSSKKSDQPTAVVIPLRAFATPEEGAAFGRAARYWSREAPDPATPTVPFASAGGGPPGLRVRYELDPAELRAQSRANRGAFRGGRRGAVVVGLLTLGCVLAAAHFGRVALTNPGSAGVAAPWLVAALVGTVIFGVAAIRAVRLIVFGPRPDARDLGPVELEVQPEALFKKTADGQEIGYAWSQLHAVEADPRFLRVILKTYLKSQPIGMVTCVPRRAFATPGDFDAFLGEARGRVAEARSLQAGPGA